MAKPTYIIYKDQPTSDAYAQYVYDAGDMLSSTGLNTLDSSDDLYSIKGFQYNLSDNFDYVLDWGEGARIQIENYPVWASNPAGTYPWTGFVTDNSTVNIYLFDGANTLDSDFESYTNIGNLISNYSPFLNQAKNNLGQTAGDLNGNMFSMGGWPSHQWWGDETPSGWFNEYEAPQNWFSNYGGAAFDWWEAGYHPVIGFDSNNYNYFLDGQTINWEEYLLDIFYNYNSYDGSNSKDYFYLVEDNRLKFYVWDAGPFEARTRIVYRYPKKLFIDAWQLGQPVTSEVMAWRIYGSGENWFDVIAGNDECWNNITHFATGWTSLGDVGTQEYHIPESELDNTWEEADTTFDCEGVGTWRPTLNLNITPPTFEIEEIPPYQPFYNMGGKNIIDVSEEQHEVFASESLGGYNVYFNEYFPGIENFPLNSSITYNDWRPISNVFIGDDYLTASYLQTYYDIEQIEYLYTSAPNIVNLYFTIQDGENQAQIVNELFGQEYYQKIIDGYVSNGMTSITVEELLSDNNRYLSQNLKFFVTNWNWKEDDDDFEEMTFPYTDEDLISYNFNDNTFIVQDAFAIDGSPNTLQYQYNSPGLKTIKAFVMSTITNNLNEEYVLVIKSLTIRIYLGLDDIYIEDFADIGGPDFTFIPWPYTSPVISGIDLDSQYIQSLNSVVDNNLFSDNELIDRNYARKALQNDEIGNYLGAVDIEQTRLFLDGSYDMAKLLGIESYYENVDAGTYYNYYPYTKFEGINRWDGINNKYPEETSVGSIFINDTLDLNLLSKCLFEFNFGSSDGRTVRDSSGNGNKGILIGDFKIKKEDKDIPIRRDSVMKTPTTNTQNGAL